MRLQENTFEHLCPPMNKGQSVNLTPILVKQKHASKLKQGPSPNLREESDLSVTPTKMSHRVSFLETDAGIGRLNVNGRQSRNMTIQYRTSSQVSPTGKQACFPPFIPDDPEKPHLSSRKKERERQAIIHQVVSELLRYKRSDWTQDKIENQRSMFDKPEPESKHLWRKLAMNLLFTGHNKNVLTTYKDRI